MSERENPRPFRAVHPGEILKAECDYRFKDMAESTVAYYLGLPIQTMQDLFSGKQPMTELIAHDLEFSLDISRGFWLRLQENYDEWHATAPEPAEPKAEA